MRSCVEQGGVVWLSRSDNPSRKLPYTWEIAELTDDRVYVNPARANDIVVEAVKANRIEPLNGYDVLRREVSYGESSRVDFVLEGSAPRCYVEVKCATLGLGDGRAAFPDSVTKRGTRHLRELMRVRAEGARTVLLFCVVRESARSVEPADDIDPEYGRTLRDAAAAGVEVLGYRCKVNPDEVTLVASVDVKL
jgi:sugar fermentation stimulation protein A